MKILLLTLNVQVKYNKRGGNTWWDQMFILGEELLTKRVKMGLFILLKVDVELAKIMRVSSLFVQKKEMFTWLEFFGM